MSQAPSSSDSIAQWALEDQSAVEAETFLAALAERLLAAGVPISRVATSLPTRHPELFSRWLTWTRGHGVSTGDVSHALVRAPGGDGATPIRQVLTSMKPLRVRLDGSEPIPWSSVRELREKGATDDYMLPVRLPIRQRGEASDVFGPASATLSNLDASYVSFNTDAPRGFRMSTSRSSRRCARASRGGWRCSP